MATRLRKGIRVEVMLQLDADDRRMPPYSWRRGDLLSFNSWQFIVRFDYPQAPVQCVPRDCIRPFPVAGGREIQIRSFNLRQRKQWIHKQWSLVDKFEKYEYRSEAEEEFPFSGGDRAPPSDDDREFCNVAGRKKRRRRSYASAGADAESFSRLLLRLLSIVLLIS